MRRMILAGVFAALYVTMPASVMAQKIVDEAPPADIAAKVAEASAAAKAGGEGPFKAEMVADARLPTHTIYRPRNMAAAAGKQGLPIVAWGNGACTNVGNRFRYFLTELASHGYVVLAVGPIAPQTAEWKVDLNAGNPLPPNERLPNSFAAQLTDAIDWAIAENSRKGSAYFGKINSHRIAVMGQSCGGLQAITAAADKRVTTAMIWNSGTFPDGTKPLPGTGDANRASLRRIHVPIAWISGDSSDVAHVNANADFAAFSGAPALRAWHKGTGHSAHFRDAHGGLFTPLAIDWLDWRLRKNAKASLRFVGAACGLCKADGWVVQQKGM